MLCNLYVRVSTYLQVRNRGNSCIPEFEAMNIENRA